MQFPYKISLSSMMYQPIFTAVNLDHKHTKNAVVVPQLGVEPFTAVVIAGFNSVQWHVSALGAIFAG